MEGQVANNKNGKVTWTIFAWSIGVILVLFGTCFTILDRINGNVAAGIQERNELKTGQAEIRTNLEWIVKTLQEQNQTLKEIQKELK
ncbi:MAG: hypothetical protein ABIA63_00180 [bacterium]